MDPRELEAREREAFSSWLRALASRPDAGQLNTFEGNLETWRQLWRVCERSHVILYLVDCRHPLFHYSEAIHRYVTEDLRKPFVLVLNKSDLSDSVTLDSWEAYFRERFSVSAMARFSAFAGFDGSVDAAAAGERRKAGRHAPRAAGAGRYSHPTGRDQVIALVRRLARERYGDELERLRAVDEGSSLPTASSLSSDGYVGDASGGAPSSVIVVGTIGCPNVGKSALINGMAMRKVVSVSRTPGHTKHFQTIRLSGCPDIVLCDCPGMVFPAIDRPKYLQVLCGLYPLPHLRDPFTPLRYVAERYALESIYHLAPFRDTPGEPWSPMAIAEALATKRGYHTGRTGRPDAHRAALEILRDCVDGSVVIYWSPPDETSEAKYKQELAEEEARLERARQRLAREKQGRQYQPIPPMLLDDEDEDALQIKDVVLDGDEDEDDEEEEEEEEEGEQEEEGGSGGIPAPSTLDVQQLI